MLSRLFALLAALTAIWALAALVEHAALAAWGWAGGVHAPPPEKGLVRWLSKGRK